jgi:mRNA interferase MazF
MTRGEVWIVGAPGDFTREPRPMIIVQSDHFDATDSVTVCGFTTDPSDAPLIRLLIHPSDINGLRLESRIMIDKVSTVRKAKLDQRIGRLEDKDMTRVNRALLVFLGLAGESNPPSRGAAA